MLFPAMFLVMFPGVAKLGNMFRTQNLCPASKNIFCFPSSKICFRNKFPARLNWETFASATMFPSLARPLLPLRRIYWSKKASS